MLEFNAAQSELENIVRPLFGNGSTVQTLHDRSVPLGTGEGCCISMFNPDFIDRASANYALRLNGIDIRPSALVLGDSRYVPQAIRLALSGAVVQVVDKDEMDTDIIGILEDTHPDLLRKITYIRRRAEVSLPVREGLNIIHANRFISHLRYRAARSLLEQIYAISDDEARFFISFSPLESTLGEGYEDATKPIQERFAICDNERARSSDLMVPLCLYTQGEVEVLLDEVGLDIDQMQISEKGQTIKVVAKIKPEL